MSGALRLSGSSSGYIELQSEAAASSSTLTIPNSGFGRILQSKTTSKKDDFSTTSTSAVVIPGLTQAITPSHASNKILVTVTIGGFGTSSGDYFGYFKIAKESSVISGALADADGSREVCTSAQRNTANHVASTVSMQYEDTAGGTSSITYAAYVEVESGATLRINSNGNDTNQSNYPRTISTITVQEIAV